MELVEKNITNKDSGDEEEDEKHHKRFQWNLK